MKKIALFLACALLAGCGNVNDFPDIARPGGGTPDNGGDTEQTPGSTDGGVNYYGDYEKTPVELYGNAGVANLATFDISADASPVTETETAIVAPAEGYDDFVENYGYDEETGEFENDANTGQPLVKQLKVNYINGVVQCQYISKKGKPFAAFTASKTLYDNDDPTIKEAEVEINGQHVTVKAYKKFNFVLTGTGSEGSSFKLYSDKKFILTLDNVSLSNNQGAAINLQKSPNMDEENKYKGKRGYIVIKGENTLMDSPSDAYITTMHPGDGTEEDEKGVIFSEGKLLVSGDGTLNITARGKHGIASDDYVYMHAGPKVAITPAEGHDAIKTNDGICIAGGVHNYTISGAEARGLNTDSLVIFKGGRTTIMSNGSATATAGEAMQPTGIKGARVIVDGGDVLVNSKGSNAIGIQAEKVFVMNAGTLKMLDSSNAAEALTGGYGKVGILAGDDDGNEGEVYVNGGTITLRAISGDDATGIKSGNRITVTGGMAEVLCSGRAFHAAKNIVVRGGGVFAQSNSAAAIVSDGIININGGVTFANSAAAGKAAMDCKNNQFAITGGTLIAVGSANSLPTAGVSTQPSFLTTIPAAANDYCSVTTADGGCIASFKPVYHANATNAVLLFSAPTLSVGGTYGIDLGGTPNLTADGVMFQGVYARGVTLSGSTNHSNVVLGGTVTDATEKE